MNIKLCPYKGGANGAYTLTFDDGCYKESTLFTIDLFKEIWEKTGVKIKATSFQTVGFLHEGLISMWQDAIRDGWYDVGGHSLNHCICFNSKTPRQELENDARLTYERLKALYPSEELITYATPGGGSDNEGRAPLKDYYMAVRNGNDGLNIPQKIDWLDVNTFTATLDKENEDYKRHIDKVVENGGWSVQINHWVTDKQEDKFHAQKKDAFVFECEYLAKLALENKIWIASFNDAVKYIQRYESATLDVSESEDIVTISLKSAPLQLADVSLSIEIESDEPFVVLGEDETELCGKQILEIKDTLKLKKAKK